MEDSAIKEGFSRLKNGEEYDALFASALCRAKADWLIGINATRLFSVLYNHTLNVGRVQTPTLKMLVDRAQRLPHLRKKNTIMFALPYPARKLQVKEFQIRKKPTH